MRWWLAVITNWLNRMQPLIWRFTIAHLYSLRLQKSSFLLIGGDWLRQIQSWRPIGTSRVLIHNCLSHSLGTLIQLEALWSFHFIVEVGFLWGVCAATCKLVAMCATCGGVVVLKVRAWRSRCFMLLEARPLLWELLICFCFSTNHWSVHFLNIVACRLSWTVTFLLKAVQKCCLWKVLFNLLWYQIDLLEFRWKMLQFVLRSWILNVLRFLDLRINGVCWAILRHSKVLNRISPEGRLLSIGFMNMGLWLQSMRTHYKLLCLFWRFQWNSIHGTQTVWMVLIHMLVVAFTRLVLG